MKNTLKNLYTHLIESRKHEVEGWHDTYFQFCGEVDNIRSNIKGGKDLSPETDGEFLKKLIYERDNGIATKGLSVLSDENFQDFIKNKDFMSSLQNFILTPDKENFDKFCKIWNNLSPRNNPVLVNRVAAACAGARKVSTTVDEGKFNQVFHWLVNKGIIQAYPKDKNQDWFSKNDFLLEFINNEFSDKLKEGSTDEFYLSMFVWKLYENISNPFRLKKQTVKYGAPGTGKTYQARQQTSLLFDIWKDEFAPDSNFKYENQRELVQFHPSFSYEDFMEGLRPVLDGNGTAQLTLQNGVFKEFCRKAAKWEIDVHNLGLDKDWESITINDLNPHKEKLSGEYWQYIFEVPDSSTLVSEAVPPFFFIIDEVNRAELSRVFGELMYCLEYRGINGKIKTQYAKLNNEDTGMLKTEQGFLFFIPTNIYLIGTMNTIDRSVESFDFALRRRFFWEEVKPDTGVLRYHLKQFCEAWEQLADNLERLNTKIEEQPLLGPDYQIGHAYLMNLKYAQNLKVNEVRKRVWDDCIRPLLQEYLRGSGKEAELIGSFGKAFGI
ncbi:MAG: AAA family ATPase [Candidatus Cloacimonetes bacterium]|nr:AAA family ATPase [Candidatus Cloacimonadota bacterium]